MTENELKEIMKKDLDEVFDVKPIIDFHFDLLQKAYIKGLDTGLKAGRPKWHDLRKNPDDLPPNEYEVYVAAINETARGKEFVYGFDRYLTDDKCWFVDSALEPIAWCEIPRFTEESKK